MGRRITGFDVGRPVYVILETPHFSYSAVSLVLTTCKSWASCSQVRVVTLGISSETQLVYHRHNDGDDRQPSPL